MQDRITEVIKAVFEEWREGQPRDIHPHPDEEDLVFFIEGQLSKGESERIKEHLISCDNCLEAVATNLKLKAAEDSELPQDWLAIHKIEDPFLEYYFAYTEINTN